MGEEEAVMSPRTNYDSRDTAGSEDYRSRRDAKIARNPDRLRRGRRRWRSKDAHREGDYYTPEETAEQDDWGFMEGPKMRREFELNRRAAGPIKSGKTTFTTEDAAAALVDRKKRRK